MSEMAGPERLVGDDAGELAVELAAAARCCLLPRCEREQRMRCPDTVPIVDQQPCGHHLLQ